MFDRASKPDMMRRVFLSKPLKIGGLHKFASSLGNIARVKTSRLQSKTLSHKTKKKRKAPQSLHSLIHAEQSPEFKSICLLGFYGKVLSLKFVFSCSINHKCFLIVLFLVLKYCLWAFQSNIHTTGVMEFHLKVQCNVFILMHSHLPTHFFTANYFTCFSP